LQITERTTAILSGRQDAALYGSQDSRRYAKNVHGVSRELEWKDQSRAAAKEHPGENGMPLPNLPAPTAYAVRFCVRLSPN